MIEQNLRDIGQLLAQEKLFPKYIIGWLNCDNEPYIPVGHIEGDDGYIQTIYAPNPLLYIKRLVIVPYSLKNAHLLKCSDTTSFLTKNAPDVFNKIADMLIQSDKLVPFDIRFDDKPNLFDYSGEYVNVPVEDSDNDYSDDIWHY